MNNKKIIDLTHTLNPNVPTWGGGCGFNHQIADDFSTQGYRTHTFKMKSGIGTHLDAPLHFVPNATDVASIPLEQLIVPAFVINIADKCHPDYFATPQDVIDFEKTFGNITQNSLVIFYTGWSQYWNNPMQYRNTNKDNNVHFPGILAITAEILLERNIAGLAIDTLSPDGSNLQFPVHHILLSANKYIIENIANANLLPATGAYTIALPPKIEEATEAPLRIVGLM